MVQSTDRTRDFDGAAAWKNDRVPCVDGNGVRVVVDRRIRRHDREPKHARAQIYSLPAAGSLS